MSNKSSHCQSQAVVQSKVIQLTIMNEEDSTNADRQIQELDIEPTDTPVDTLVSDPEESIDASKVLEPVIEENPITSRDGSPTKTFEYEEQ